MIRIVFSLEAEADALTAFKFYEERREGLGERFRDHVSVALGRVQLNPEQSPIVYRDARRRLIERFPYAIISRVCSGAEEMLAALSA